MMFVNIEKCRWRGHSEGNQSSEAETEKELALGDNSNTTCLYTTWWDKSSRAMPSLVEFGLHGDGL